MPKKIVDGAWEEFNCSMKEVDGAWQSCTAGCKPVDGAWEQIWGNSITLIENGVKNSEYVGSNTVNAIYGSASEDNSYSWEIYADEYDDTSSRAEIQLNTYIAMNGNIDTSQYGELVVEYSLTKTQGTYNDKLQAYGQHPSYGYSEYVDLTWGNNQTVVVDLASISAIRNMCFYIRYDCDMGSTNPSTFTIHNAYLR